MHIVEWSRPERQRQGTPLLLMLHGYGSDEQRMARLFEELPKGLTCAALRAPKDISGDYGWFLLDYFLNNDFAEVVSSAADVLAWLDGVMAQNGFSSVSVLGYSQGMAMATTLIRLRPEQFTAAVGLSGFVLDNDLLGGPGTRLPFFWARDTEDLVINPDATKFTAGWLAANTDLQEARYAGLGHNTRSDELRDVSAFLTGHIPGAFVPGA